MENNICIFETKYNSIARINTNNLVGIETDNNYVGELSSGEKIKMRFTYNSVNKTRPHTDYGDIKINPPNLVSLIRVIDTKKTSPQPTPAKGAEGRDSEYGTDTKKEAPLDFLIGSTVLLAPGSWQLEFGVNYKKNKSTYALPQINQFQRSTYEARRLDLTTGLRAGLMKNLEGWVSVPFSYLQVEDVSTNEYVRGDSEFRIGDIQAGLQYELVNESAHCPAVTVNFSASAPTGAKRYLEGIDSWRNSLSNSSGHWVISPGLSFVKKTDPAILFAGINYEHAFENKIDGYNVKPGWGINGCFGVGFALNEELSLGTRLSYGYFDDMYVDGTRIEGSSTEPLDLSFTLSYRIFDSIIATPYVTFGLNDDAGPAAVGINLTKSF